MPNIDNLMMGSFTIPVTAEPSSTLCGNRITVARHMLQCANNIAAFLENPENGLNNQNIDLLAQQTMESTILEVGISAVTDADLPQNEMQSIVQAFQGAVSEAFRQNGINNITVQQHSTAPGSGTVVGSLPSQNNNGATASSSITIEFPPNITDSSNSSNSSNDEPAAPRQPEAVRRQQTTSPTVLADVVEMMQNVQQRLAPFVQQYYTMLREDPSYSDDEARERAQQIFNRTSEALHYMAHAQHAISDLMLNLSLPTPRHLCCRPILVEQSAFVSSGISQVSLKNLQSVKFRSFVISFFRASISDHFSDVARCRESLTTHRHHLQHQQPPLLAIITTTHQHRRPTMMPQIRRIHRRPVERATTETVSFTY